MSSCEPRLESPRGRYNKKTKNKYYLDRHHRVALCTRLLSHLPVITLVVPLKRAWSSKYVHVHSLNYYYCRSINVVFAFVVTPIVEVVMVCRAREIREFSVLASGSSYVEEPRWPIVHVVPRFATVYCSFLTPSVVEFS